MACGEKVLNLLQNKTKQNKQQHPPPPQKKKNPKKTPKKNKTNKQKTTTSEPIFAGSRNYFLSKRNIEQ